MSFFIIMNFMIRYDIIRFSIKFVDNCFNMSLILLEICFFYVNILIQIVLRRMNFWFLLCNPNHWKILHV